MSINRVVISGNITKDPVLRHTKNKVAILSFRLAVNDRVRDKETKEWSTRANYVDCTILGARAEALSGVLQKSQKIAVEGKLRESSWEKDGQHYRKLEVKVDDVDFLTNPKKKEDSTPAGPASEEAPAAEAAPTPTIDVTDLQFEEVPPSLYESAE